MLYLFHIINYILCMYVSKKCVSMYNYINNSYAVVRVFKSPRTIFSGTIS